MRIEEMKMIRNGGKNCPDEIYEVGKWETR
jgi:hypothetical protein